MRFYFHLVGPTGATPDDAGLDACSLEVAEAESRQAMQEIRDDDMFAGEDWDGWQLEITDASHQVLVTIPLDQSQEGHGEEKPWHAVKRRATWINSMLVAVGCGIYWQSPLAMF
jgi:hypothetical protein